MPLQQTSGNDTQDAYGGGAAAVPTYVENVFSTYLYTGTGATQSITNNIDLSDNGGLVWIKCRDNAQDHMLFDTVRGPLYFLKSDTTAASANTYSNTLTSFNTNGFTLGADGSGNVNQNGYSQASWTFRKAPKFFDIVTYTGTGSAHSINHNLGSTPGCIIVKDTSNTNAWSVYHKGLNGGTTPEQYYAVLNTNAAQIASSAWWNNTAPTSTQFTVGTNTTVNASGHTYIAYIFGAGGTGGFGLTRTQNIISCGSFTTDGSGNATVNLGWEPQWILFKAFDAVSGWNIDDTMRGLSYANGEQRFFANTSSAEINVSPGAIVPTATGFNVTNSILPSSTNWIYIAIRRGPMAVPTDPTTVFVPVAATPSGATTVTTNFPVDLNISTVISSNGYDRQDWDRLRGSSQSSGVILYTDTTAAEGSDPYGGIGFDSNTSIVDNWWNSRDGVTTPVIYWNFKRAPGFFDEVCYTGTGVLGQTQSHNLGVAPELMIVKNRDAVVYWPVYVSSLGATKGLYLNTNDAQQSFGNVWWNSVAPTSTTLTFGQYGSTGTAGNNYVAYLFATCSGVSKVGLYTGNGTGQSIACGFGASGARFILIKRTDSSGDWYCFDSANGLTSSSSPYLTWDTSNAQTTGNNGVYASSGGFTLGATAVTTTNIATASYIFLAIA